MDQNRTKVKKIHMIMMEWRDLSLRNQNHNSRESPIGQG
jgi:hypothetical protein